MELTTFIHGSAHDLHQLADGSVQMIATSPPYYGLRAYAGEQGVEWPEVTFRLNEWVEPTVVAPMRCGLGMEPTPVAFIGHLILCLREWRRVLRDDGTVWVNLGDSYAGAKSYGRNDTARIGASLGSANPVTTANSKYLNGLKSESSIDCGLESKNLLGIPWLFAIAARADGWYLRSDIIWAKPNPMPESVTDRPTKSHEYVFLLSKQAKYFWDAEGVKEASVDPESLNGRRKRNDDKFVGQPGSETRSGFSNIQEGTLYTTRNLRTVWTIATQPTPFAHFATWPEKLVETMIRAGSSERGACPHCGKAWVRVVEREKGDTESAERPKAKGQNGYGKPGSTLSLSGNGSKEWAERGSKVTDLGFAPACTCPAHEPVPCVVLDPFNGSGTTGKVAVQLGRAYVGVDIATEYLDGVTSERFGAGVQIGMGM